MKNYSIETKGINIIKEKGYMIKEICHYPGEKYGFSINLLIMEGLSNEEGLLGRDMRFNFEKRIKYVEEGLAIIFPDGEEVIYEQINDSYYKGSKAYAYIRGLGNGDYEVLQNDLSIEIYNYEGKIKEIRDKDRSLIISYTYEADKLVRISNYIGESINFGYNGDKLVRISKAEECVCEISIDNGSGQIIIEGVRYIFNKVNQTISLKSVDAENNEIEKVELISYENPRINKMRNTFKNEIKEDINIKYKTLGLYEVEDVIKGVSKIYRIEEEKIKYEHEYLEDIFMISEETNSYVSKVDVNYNIENQVTGTLKAKPQVLTMYDEYSKTYTAVITRIEGVNRYLFSMWIKREEYNCMRFEVKLNGNVVEEIDVSGNIIGHWEFISKEIFIVTPEEESFVITVEINDSNYEVKDLRLSSIDSNALCQISSIKVMGDNNEYELNEIDIYNNDNKIEGNLSGQDIIYLLKMKLFNPSMNIIFYNDGQELLYGNDIEFKIGQTSVNVESIRLYKKVENTVLKYLYIHGITPIGNLYFEQVKEYNASGEYRLIKEANYNNRLELITSWDADGLKVINNNQGIRKTQKISNVDETLNIEQVWNYDLNENMLISEESSLEEDIDYTYENGLIKTIACGDETIEYDYIDKLVSKKTINNNEIEYEYTYEGIEKISVGTNEYNYEYENNGYLLKEGTYKIASIIDDKENQKIIRRNYISDNSYEENNIYYDKYGRVTRVVENNQTILERKYNLCSCINSQTEVNTGSSVLEKEIDYKTNTETKYLYDLEGSRIIGYSKNIIGQTENIFEKNYTYLKSKISTETLGDESEILAKQYQYYENDMIKDITYQKTGIEGLLCKISYGYDDLKRLTTKELLINTTPIKQQYTYKTNGNETNYQVECDKLYVGETLINESHIEYDNLGRIAQIREGNETKKRYGYDNLGRLIREDNKDINRTTTYSYDSNSNIVEKKYYSFSLGTLTSPYKNINYGYDSIRRNQLISYDNENINIDYQGRLLVINGYNANYTNNRLTNLVKGNIRIGGESYSYEYNKDGLRSKKTYTSLSLIPSAMYLEKTRTHEYEYDLNKIIKEKIHVIYYNQTEHDIIIEYLYNNEEVIGFIRTENNTKEKYYYIRNILGEITKIYNSNNELMGEYKYDAYGNVISYTDTNGVLSSNPFRYKGYYYDRETGLYWVSSRYYSPELCRWISPDSIEYLDPESINGLNLYAYCGNDPINKYDPSGHSAILTMVLIGTLFGAAVGFGFDAGKQLINNGWDFSEVDWGSAVNSAIVGGALGFSLAMGVGYLGPVIAGTATAGGLTAGGAFAISTAVSFGAGALGYATEEWMNGRTPSFGKAMMHGGFVALEGMVNFGVGGIVGSLGNVGTKGKFLTSKEWWGKFIFGLEFTQPFKIGIDYIRKNI